MSTDNPDRREGVSPDPAPETATDLVAPEPAAAPHPPAEPDAAAPPARDGTPAPPAGQRAGLQVPAPTPFLGEDGAPADSTQSLDLPTAQVPVTKAPVTQSPVTPSPAETTVVSEAGAAPVSSAPGSQESRDVIDWEETGVAPVSEPAPVTRRSIFAEAETPTTDPVTEAVAPTPVGGPLGPASPAEPTAVTPAVTAAAAATAAQPDGDLGTSPGRHRHWAGVLLAVVLLPFAWFFLHDSAAQVMASVDTHRFALDITGLVELAVGAGALALALWAARRSSLGTIVVGALTLLVGLPALVLPSLMDQYLTPLLDRLALQSSLGEDLASYLWSDAVTGRFAWLGLLLLMIGVVSHSARRAGRREQEVVDRVRKTPL